MSINKVVITGRLTKDAELKSGSGNTRVLVFSIASNERYKAGDDWKERANFIDCVMFGARAEAISKYLKKGTQVAIDGKLRFASWETESGKHSKLDVVVDDIELLSRVKEEKPAEAASEDVPYL